MRLFFLFSLVCETLSIVFGVICFCAGLFLVADPDCAIKNIGVEFNKARENLNTMTQTMNKYPGLQISNPPDFESSHPLHDTNFREFVKRVGVILTVTGFLLASTGIVTLVATLIELITLQWVCVAVALFWAIVELIACVVFLKCHEPANYFLRRHFKHQLNTEYVGYRSHDLVSIGWNLIMKEYKCCGVDSYLDFNSSTSYNEKWYDPSHSYSKTRWLKAPVTCCNEMYINNTARPKIPGPCTNDEFINKKGCLSVFWEAVDRHKAEVGICFTLMIVVQVATVFCLCWSRFKQESTVLPTTC